MIGFTGTGSFGFLIPQCPNVDGTGIRDYCAKYEFKLLTTLSVTGKQKEQLIPSINLVFSRGKKYFNY